MKKIHILIIALSGILAGFIFSQFYSSSPNEPVNIIDFEYSDESNYEIPKEAKRIKDKAKNDGTAYIIEKNGHTIVYLTYIYNTVTGEPEIYSYSKQSNDLVITVKPVYKEEGGIGLMAMSYHSFKIELNGTFDNVIIKEIKNPTEQSPQ